MTPKRSHLTCLVALLGLICLAAACHRRMAAPKPYLALVADQAGESVAVVNLEQFSLARVVELGFSPLKIDARPGHAEVFVTSLTGQVAVIRFPGLAVVGGFKTGRGLNTLVFTPGGDTAYVLGNDGNWIYKVDCASLRVLNAFHMPDPLASIAWVENRNVLLGEDVAEGSLVLINPQSGAVTGSVNVGPGAGSLVILPSGGKAFLAAPSTNEVTAVDLADKQILSRIDVGFPPSLLVLKPDAGELFALSGQDSTMTILNVSYDSVEESHPSGADPVAAVFSRDSRWLYIANAGDGTVTRVDVGSRQEFVTHVGMRPQALALTPDERFLAVVDSEGDRLSVMRAATGDLMTAIPVGAGPVDVAIPGWMGK